MNIVCVFFEFDENFLKKLTKAGLILDEGVSVDCLLGEVSGEVIGVANFNGCDILISNPDNFLCEEFSEFLTSFSNESSLFMLLSQDASGGLWFEFHKNGEMKRQWVMVEGEVQSNIGAPLNALDKSIFCEFDEDACDFWAAVELMEQVTGVKWESLEGKGTIHKLSAPLPFK